VSRPVGCSGTRETKRAVVPSSTLRRTLLIRAIKDGACCPERAVTAFRPRADALVNTAYPKHASLVTAAPLSDQKCSAEPQIILKSISTPLELL